MAVYTAIQAGVVHANVGFHFGPLEYLIVTPQFHHWHHSSQQPAIDTNYCVQLPLFDLVFGTFHLPGSLWPAHYGTTNPMPYSYLSQFVYPFKPEPASNDPVDPHGLTRPPDSRP